MILLSLFCCQEPQVEVEAFGDGGAGDVGGSRFSKWFHGTAMGTGQQEGNSFIFVNRNSPAPAVEDFRFLTGE